MMVTALRSESKPTPSCETSFTTMASSDLASSFLRAFSRTFSVSAAKPDRRFASVLLREQFGQDIGGRFQFQGHRAFAFDLLLGRVLGR